MLLCVSADVSLTLNNFKKKSLQTPHILQSILIGRTSGY